MDTTSLFLYFLYPFVGLTTFFTSEDCLIEGESYRFEMTQVCVKNVDFLILVDSHFYEPVSLFKIPRIICHAVTVVEVKRLLFCFTASFSMK